MFASKVMFGALPTDPFFVVIKTTPLEALEPYIAVDEASLRTSIDSISFGFIPLNALSTPSTKMSGSLLLLMEEPPRIRMVASSPGVLLFE
ncbi:hypothetical protein SDC9_98126 [bioreactor metagenome]|uniref:Uncharacterized protein n=1 Tax=bioreactor metagenome TaxID=1076179 RepID=A0A645AF88_9ZZZZ